MSWLFGAGPRVVLMLRDIHENAILGAYEGHLQQLRRGARPEGFRNRPPREGAISLLEMRQTDSSRSEAET